MSAVPSQPEGLASILRELVDLSRGPAAAADVPLRGDETQKATDASQASREDPAKWNANEGPKSGTI